MKKEKALDPLRLDVAALAREGAPIDGEWTLGALARLAEATVSPPGDGAQAPVRWQAVAESRALRGGAAQLWLQLQAEAAVWLQCQRCLQPMRQPLQVERAFRFVRDEAQADAEDLDSEEDVLALQRSLDLQALVEDELLLALPLVPRHEICPEPLPQPADDLPEAPAAEAANPFAKLVVLKRGGRQGN